MTTKEIMRLIIGIICWTLVILACIYYKGLTDNLFTMFLVVLLAIGGCNFIGSALTNNDDCGD